MSLTAAQTAFARNLGHAFANPALLETALTHSSISSNVRPANERLEFLGDRVLNLVIAEALLDQDKAAQEGDIAPRLNALVRKETCAEVAESIGLGEALILGRAEAKSGGRRKIALLGDGMEAVIAAVYRDAGFDAARRVIRRLWHDRIKAADKMERDPKTQLQEWAQARGWALPRYVDVDRSGPDHAPVFGVEVRLENDMAARGTAKSKRQAQQEAAAQMLARIEGLNDDG
ncbi:ribonuclease-3 [Rubricella aquisinus]|uniref:Ribonuclease 3 n=1 Tax=Rubricella aquisinus TaxID=2028108 RepID=A0A840WJP5_9RHOB|nr:ribonuclease-3 [Rubricella aquisinus]